MKKKYSIFLKVTPYVILVLSLKLIAHYFNFEILSLNPFFPGIVAANVFLMGFLLSGVLSDYKESEKLPGELASSIYVIIDESIIIYKTQKANTAKDCLISMNEMVEHILMWFHKKEKTKEIMDRIFNLSEYFLSYETHLQANFIVRLKQEQKNMRTIVNRIHTIRETDFVSAGYHIAVCMTVFLSLGLILSKIDPFYESMFFVGVITFFLTYLLFLIRDLDNPFGYYEHNSVEDVSLKALEDLQKNLVKRLENLEIIRL
jgi:hypothetical protein